MQCFVVVNVSFDMDLYWDGKLEKRLNAIAKALGGTNGSSGAGFGTRDVGYYFKSLSNARSFAVRARRFKAVSDVEGGAIL